MSASDATRNSSSPGTSRCKLSSVSKSDGSVTATTTVVPFFATGITRYRFAMCRGTVEITSSASRNPARLTYSVLKCAAFACATFAGVISFRFSSSVIVLSPAASASSRTGPSCSADNIPMSTSKSTK